MKSRNWISALVLPAVALSWAAVASAAPQAGPSARATAGTVGPATPQVIEEGQVIYDKRKDTLTANIKGSKLSEVLFMVARQSGMDVRMDPKTDRSVTMEFKDVPLERAVDRLTGQGLNVLKSFDSAGKGKKDLLIGLVILPAGQSDASTAVSLLSLDREIGMRAGQMYSQTAAGKRTGRQADLMAKRWQQRQKALTPAQQAAYAARMKQLEEKALEREKRRAEAKERREKHQADRLATLPPTARDRVEPGRKKPDPKLLEKARRDFAQPDNVPDGQE